MLSRRKEISYPFESIVEPVTCDDVNFSGLVVPFRRLRAAKAAASWRVPVVGQFLVGLVGVCGRSTTRLRVDWSLTQHSGSRAAQGPWAPLIRIGGLVLRSVSVWICCGDASSS
jgi:hypothetical protein